MALNKKVSVFLVEAVNSIYFLRNVTKKAGHASIFLFAKPVLITIQVNHNNYKKFALCYKANPVPVVKNVLMLTGNLPVGFSLPVITFTADRCISSLIW